jgi:hypothetical protein
VFIDQAVYNNFELYQANKEVEGIKYTAGAPEVFGFIEEIQNLPVNNAIAPFDMANDIVVYLKEQWAGLFQRLLQESALHGQQQAMEDFRTAATTLEQLVTFLTEERKNTNASIQDILLSSHPAFADIRKKSGINHRVLFTNVAELDSLLVAYGFSSIYDPFHDDGVVNPYTWSRSRKGNKTTICTQAEVFDGAQKLRFYRPDEWKPEWVSVKNEKIPDPDEYDPFKDE